MPSLSKWVRRLVCKKEVVVSEETKIQQPGYPSNPTEMKKERTGFFGRKKKQEAIIPVTQTDQQEAYPAAQIKEKKGTWNLLRKKKEKLVNTVQVRGLINKIYYILRDNV